MDLSPRNCASTHSRLHFVQLSGLWILLIDLIDLTAFKGVQDLLCARG